MHGIGTPAWIEAMKATPSVAVSNRSFRLSRSEWVSLAALASIVGIWALLPFIPQDPGYHNFADQRRWLGIEHAADVLSNIGLALVGLVGAVLLLSTRHPDISPETRAAMWCTTGGLLLTAAGSGWYHLNPNDSTLVWDRLPMTLAFAGIFSVAIAQRVGPRAARASLAVLIPLGIASVAYWRVTGDLSLYAALQFGGGAAMVALLSLTPRDGDPFPWRWVVVCYVLAKVVEGADRLIWDASGHIVAGHMLKHLLAAAAGAAMLWPLRGRGWRSRSVG